ncbi:MAG TPA: chemotaxis protein CheX [Gemmatirosa sp.]|nr:chemotaxis protein CheX [Gemmatirosa sp.]
MPCPLRTTATATFESLALLLAEAMPADASSDVPLAHAMRVPFVDAAGATGALVVAVSDDVAAALAANMLGVATARADAAARSDALGELANVVCGNVLPAVAGRAAVFHLGAPAAIPLTEALLALALASDALRAELAVEAGRAALCLQLPAGLALRPSVDPVPMPHKASLDAMS